MQGIALVLMAIVIFCIIKIIENLDKGDDE